jgi:hypothetical protein
MNLKQFAEEKGISLSEAKEFTGLTHWKQEVPELRDEAVVETESKEDQTDGVDPAVVELSLRCLGSKSKYWNK